MTKILIVLFILTIQFMVTGFEEYVRGRTQIENLYPIIVGGIDKGNGGGNEFIITTVSPTTEEEADKPNSIMSVSGRTAFEANRRIGNYADNDIFWGHTKYVLIGDEAAAEGVFKYLEFFIRDHEPRATIIPIYINGVTSQELIHRLYDQNIDISKTIDRIIENLSLFSYSSTFDLLEFVSLTSESKDGYLPCLEFRQENKTLLIEPESEEVETGEVDAIYSEGKNTNDYTINITGYALIKDGKVIDHLSYERGRGLNWLLDEIKSGVIVVDQNGVRYNLEITVARSKIKTSIDDDNLAAQVDIEINADITEIDTVDIELNGDLIKKLENKAEDKIKKEAQEVMHTIQDHNIDIISLGDYFHREHPVKWEKNYKEKWKEIFPEVPVDIQVNMKIEKAGKFKEGI